MIKEELDDVVETAEGVHVFYKVLGAVIFFLSVGFGVGVFVTMFSMHDTSELVDSIEDLTEDHEEYDERIQTLEEVKSQYERVVCILEMQLEGVESEEILNSCRPPLFNAGFRS